MDSVLPYFGGFMLVFCRITSFFVVAPIFSARHIPGQFKVALSFFVAFLVFSALGASQVAIDGMYILAILKEVLVGLVLGFTAYLFFTVVQIAGSFIDLQMGLSLANIIDPMTGASSPIIGNLKYTIAVLIFLAINGHHYLLNAIMSSYRWVPLQTSDVAGLYNGQLSDFLFRAFTDTFAIAFQMGAPLIVALFLTDIGLGILSRTAPQFNIFVVGIPVKLLVGLLLLIVVMPDIADLFDRLFESMFESMQKLMDLLASTITRQ